MNGQPNSREGYSRPGGNLMTVPLNPASRSASTSSEFPFRPTFATRAVSTVSSIADIVMAFDVGLHRSGKPFGGVVSDVGRRAEHYIDDYTSFMHAPTKTISAGLFMFFTTFAPTVALGAMVMEKTDGSIGVTEFLLCLGFCGLFHAIFATQPLLILRPTGPVSVFILQLYSLSKDFGFDFFTWLAAVGIWVGVDMIIIAALDGSYCIRYMSRFLQELYEAFVCTIYAVQGIAGVVHAFYKESILDALFSLCLAVIVVSVGLCLSSANRTSLFSKTLRGKITDFALPIAIAIAIAVSYADVTYFKVSRITMPKGLNPSQEGRPWVTPLDFSPKMVLLAGIAAVPIVALFFIDQSISALLTQVPSIGLKKGSYYHQPFLLTSLFNLVFPVFGMPFITASLPHSPQFAAALSDVATGGKAIDVHENRIAPLIVYGLCLFSLFLPSLLELIPLGVVNGILAFVGIFGLMSNNEFIGRLLLLFTPATELPPDFVFASIKPSRIHYYTCIQLAAFAICWVITTTKAGLAFPLFIVSIIPFQRSIMPMLFSEHELHLLDSEDVAEFIPADDLEGFIPGPSVFSERLSVAELEPVTRKSQVFSGGDHGLDYAVLKGNPL
eukprot:gb/GEZN01004834.1/.p1 GENE.gb/GEZN01004834.1/~~gb/GEZN01004834.1/.p1  ORF type:complete len:612 (+),score=9.63 gb/GEZN01004834.1/:30-1865(+)